MRRDVSEIPCESQRLFYLSRCREHLFCSSTVGFFTSVCADRIIVKCFPLRPRPSSFPLSFLLWSDGADYDEWPPPPPRGRINKVTRFCKLDLCYSPSPVTKTDPLLEKLLLRVSQKVSEHALPTRVQHGREENSILKRACKQKKC